MVNPTWMKYKGRTPWEFIVVPPKYVTTNAATIGAKLFTVPQTIRDQAITRALLLGSEAVMKTTSARGIILFNLLLTRYAGMSINQLVEIEKREQLNRKVAMPTSIQVFTEYLSASQPRGNAAAALVNEPIPSNTPKSIGLAPRSTA